MKYPTGLVRLWIAFGSLQLVATAGLVAYVMVAMSPSCPTPDDVAGREPSVGQIQLVGPTASAVDRDFSRCADATVLHIPSEELIIGPDDNLLPYDRQEAIKQARKARDADLQRCLDAMKRDRDGLQLAAGKAAAKKQLAERRAIEAAMVAAKMRQADVWADIRCRFNPILTFAILFGSITVFALLTLVAFLANWVLQGFQKPRAP